MEQGLYFLIGLICGGILVGLIVLLLAHRKYLWEKFGRRLETLVLPTKNRTVSTGVAETVISIQDETSYEDVPLRQSSPRQKVCNIEKKSSGFKFDYQV